MVVVGGGAGVALAQFAMQGWPVQPCLMDVAYLVLLS